jgi:hypothetical protein
MTGLGLLWAGAATLAAPAQDRPGLMTQPRVFVENRTRAEAIPVSVQDVASGAFRIQVDRPVTLSPESVVQARLVAQPWEYRTLLVRPGEDLADALAGLGSQGWETTGSQQDANGGTAVLLKRPASRQ